MTSQAAVRQLDMTIEEYESINPVHIVDHEGVQIVYCTPTSPTKWRADRVYVNEPKTLDWIAGFADDDTLMDIGANVGIYSIWAAKTRGTRVFALEPESQNYAILNKNILINGLTDTVTAYCLAISDGTRISELNLSSFSAGQALHAFERPVNTIDAHTPELRPFTPVFRQGCVSFTIDSLVESGFPLPDHVKVDVDGFEDQVIAGAHKALERRETKSLLIEINQNLESHLEIVSYLEGLGWSVDDKSDVNFIFRR